MATPDEDVTSTNLLTSVQLLTRITCLFAKNKRYMVRLYLAPDVGLPPYHIILVYRLGWRRLATTL